MLKKFQHNPLRSYITINLVHNRNKVMISPTYSIQAQIFEIRGKLDRDGVITASYVGLVPGSYISFKANDGQEIGFGTREILVNDDYHIIQGTYGKFVQEVKGGAETLKFIGELVDGHREGYGYMTTYSDGELSSRYEGQFKNHQFDGSGVYEGKGTYDGWVYVGTYKQHKKWTGKLYNFKKDKCPIEYEGGEEVENLCKFAA